MLTRLITYTTLFYVMFLLSLIWGIRLSVQGFHLTDAASLCANCIVPQEYYEQMNQNYQLAPVAHVLGNIYETPTQVSPHGQFLGKILEFGDSIVKGIRNIQNNLSQGTHLNRQPEWLSVNPVEVPVVHVHDRVRLPPQPPPLGPVAPMKIVSPALGVQISTAPPAQAVGNVVVGGCTEGCP